MILGFTDLQESLLVLVPLKMQIETALRSIEPEKTEVVMESRLKDEDLKFTVCNHLKILLCSFLEEWKILEAQGSNKKIQKTLKITSPALKRIRKWKGLSKERSNLLAHGPRNKQGEFTLPLEIVARYYSPTKYAETILLGMCAILAIELALACHNVEYQEAVNKLPHSSQEIVEKGISTFEEITTEINKIRSEMRELQKNC
ncbi:MAG: hypothetical protein KAT70_04030 [Thermoplasmata archaeon]|nr:hypothetical protein [Thermoplasmata archaeon]